MSTLNPDPRGLPPSYPFKPDWEVTPRDVKARLDANAFGPLDADTPLLLDCRRPDEFATARIAGAVLVPMEELPRRLDDLEGPTQGRAREIVVHCHHGRRSLQVAAALRQAGFPNVKSMAGGIDAWSLAIDPGVKRY